MTVTRDGGSPFTFELECFDWAGPDRLEVKGTFAELPPMAAAEPLLVVHGEDGEHRLVPVGKPGGRPRPGKHWRVAFAWQEPPAPFTTAELRLGDARVELPALCPDGEPVQTLAVLPGGADAPASSARLHLEAELLSARERTHELERELARASAELERTRADLDAEREGRAQDAKRFREGLEAVERAAAEELEQARTHFDVAE